MSTYAELLNEGNVDIATEGFSFKELGEKILKLLGKVLDWIKRVKNKIVRFLKRIRDYKVEKQNDDDRINSMKHAVDEREEDAREKIASFYKKAEEEHKRKREASRKIYVSFMENLNKTVDHAESYAFTAQLWEASANIELEAIRVSTFNSDKAFRSGNHFIDANKFKAHNGQEFDFNIPEFPEIESENFEHTCDSIAYYLASQQRFKQSAEALLKNSMQELDDAEKALNKAKRLLEYYLPKVNQNDVNKIRPVLAVIQKYIAQIGKATQCIDRSITLSQNVKIEYGTEMIKQESKDNMSITAQAAKAREEIFIEEQKHHKAFKNGRFSKDYREWYNEKYPISGE